MGSGIAPAGVDGEYDAGREENLACEKNPAGPWCHRQPLTGRITQEEKTDHDHLRSSLGFSRGVCSEDGAVGEGELSQSGDEKIAGDEDDGDPCGDIVRPRQTDEGGSDKNFVRQRIHKAAEVGFTLPPACEGAVQVVTQDGERERESRDGGAPGHCAFAGGDEDRREDEADDGEAVGKGHRRELLRWQTRTF